MLALADIASARKALRRYLVHAEDQLPDDTFARLEELNDSPSPVDTIVRSAELLYARRDQLDDEGFTITAQLASFAAANGWHGMATDNRGGLIAQAMRRELGEEPGAGQPPFQPPEEDPNPATEYVVEPPAAPASDTGE